MTINVLNVQTSDENTSFLYTPSVGTNTCLVVVMGNEDVSNNNPMTPPTVDAVAISTAVQVDSTGGAGHAMDIGIFYKVAPGTAQVTIATQDTPERRGWVAMTLDNVDQSTPVDDTDGVNLTTGDPAVTVTPTVSPSRVISAAASNNSGVTFTAPATATEHSSSVLHDTSWVMSSASEARTDTSAVTHTWNSTPDSGDFSAVAAVFKEAVATVTIPRLIMSPPLPGEKRI